MNNDKNNTWHAYHTVWLLAVIVIIICGIYWLTYKASQKSIPPRINHKRPSRFSIVTPSVTPTPTVDKRITWADYKSEPMKLYFTYPTAFKITESGGRIDMTLDYPERPARYLTIERVDKSNIQHLLDLSVGGQYIDPIVKEIDIVTTRKPDIYVSFIRSYLYETNTGWEEPGPIRTIIIPVDEGYYKVKMLYSNLTDNEKSADSPLDTNYTDAFNIVVDTLYISRTTHEQVSYDETYWKKFETEPFNFTFLYPGYWFPRLSDNINYGQHISYQDPSYGNPECRGDCPVFFMSFGQSTLNTTDDLKTIIEEKFRDYDPEKFKWDTLTTEQNITFTKVSGIPGGAYYILFTIHDDKLYQIAVGAGANAMLVEPSDPETKNDLLKFEKSLNSFTFINEH